MERALMLVKDITPATLRPWTVKVTITDKSSAREARNSPKKFQRLVLTDEEGNRVQLTLFGDSIAMFSDRLQMYNTYYISNAIVRPSAPQYRIGSNCYQWTLNSTCLVEEAEATPAQVSSLDSDYIPIERIPDYKDSGILIDMLVVALHLLPVKPIVSKAGPTVLREIIVIDKSLCPAVLTLWGHFATGEAAAVALIIEQKPVLAALRVRVSSYNGLSISSRGSSSFHVQPPTAAAIAMRSWLHDNIASVNALASSPELVAVARSFGAGLPKETTSLASIKLLSQLKLFHVNCRLQMLDLKQNLLRKKCSSCSKPTSAEISAVYTCNYCTKKNVTCLPGLRADVVATDVSGELPITLYDTDVATFFRCDYNALLENQLQPQPESTLLFDNSDPRLEVHLQVKAYNSLYLGSNTRKYSGTYVSVVPNTKASMTSAAHSSSSPDLDTLQSLVDLTDIEKQMLQQIRERIESKARGATSLAIKDSEETASEAKATISDESCEENVACSTLSIDAGSPVKSPVLETPPNSHSAFFIDADNLIKPPVLETPPDSHSLCLPAPGLPGVTRVTMVDGVSTTPNKTVGMKRASPCDMNSTKVKRELFPRPV